MRKESYKDPVVAEIKKIRRKLSARLSKARSAGRFLDELRVIEREGERAYQEVMNGAGKPRRRRRA